MGGREKPLTFVENNLDLQVIQQRRLELLKSRRHRILEGLTIPAWTQAVNLYLLTLNTIIDQNAFDSTDARLNAIEALIVLLEDETTDQMNKQLNC